MTSADRIRYGDQNGPHSGPYSLAAVLKRERRIGPNRIEHEILSLSARGDDLRQPSHPLGKGDAERIGEFL